jgi:type II secretory ATPase GspE/PulE/Tfp pilus assembly ATPase PilB-like protein
MRRSARPIAARAPLPISTWATWTSPRWPTAPPRSTTCSTRDDSPVIRLINALLLEAVKEGASDVHIETQEKRLVVRFRVDGVLRDMIEPPRALAPLLVSRIKVMAKLDIAERAFRRTAA